MMLSLKNNWRNQVQEFRRELNICLKTKNAAHSASPILKPSKIEMPSILFFRILMTVAALESLGLVFNLGSTFKSNRY